MRTRLQGKILPGTKKNRHVLLTRRLYVQLVKNVT